MSLSPLPTILKCPVTIFKCQVSILNALLQSSMANRVSQKNQYAKYAYLGAYLGARNMVKWGVPEKILQNAVQTRWS